MFHYWHPEYDELLLSFAFYFNLRHYNQGSSGGAAEGTSTYEGEEVKKEEGDDKKEEGDDKKDDEKK